MSILGGKQNYEPKLKELKEELNNTNRVTEELFLGYPKSCYNNKREPIIEKEVNEYPCFLGNFKSVTHNPYNKSKHGDSQYFIKNKFWDPFLTVYGIEMSLHEVYKVDNLYKDVMAKEYKVNFNSNYVMVSALRRTWASAIIYYSYNIIKYNLENEQEKEMGVGGISGP